MRRLAKLMVTGWTAGLALSIRVKRSQMLGRYPPSVWQSSMSFLPSFGSKSKYSLKLRDGAPNLCSSAFTESPLSSRSSLNLAKEGGCSNGLPVGFGTGSTMLEPSKGSPLFESAFA